MKRNNRFRWSLVIFLVAWALWQMYPPTDRDFLQEFVTQAAGQDTNFTAMVSRARTLDKENPERAYANLLAAIGTNDIAHYFPNINVATETDPTRAILNRIQQRAAGKIHLGLDLRGGTAFLLGMDTNRFAGTAEAEEKARALSQAVEVLRKRVDRLGVAEPMIQPQGEDKILVALPGLSEAANEVARTTIQKAAVLEFRMVHPDSDEFISQGIPAPGYEILRLKPKKGDTKAYPYLVKIKPERGLTGKYVKSAMVARHPVSNEPEIHLSFNSEGAKLFGDITTDYQPQGNKHFLLGIVLDGELYSAPRINEPITGGSATISGNFDIQEALELANVLQNPLEAKLSILSEERVDPSLGKDSIRSGIVASVVGTLLVVLFMLVYYQFAGLVANSALMLNIIMLFGVMCSVGTTLTIPGIAGIVLTIGMSVDANVLIYERIREELAAGKSLRGAIDAGYARAFGTILDSHLTTLISSVILIWMGTGSVKGFGVTLSIGVSLSMFTALIVTRLIFDFVLAKGWLKTLRMFHLIRAQKIDFMRWAKVAFASTWTFIAIGTSYGIYRGAVRHDLLGVDFAGGDDLTLKFVAAQKVPVNDVRATVNKVLAEAKAPQESVVQYQKDLGTGNETLRIMTPFEMGAKVQDRLTSDYPQTKFEKLALYKAGPTIGAEILKTAIVSSLLAMFGILVYVAMRYEFSFAVGAVLGIVHDVLLTLGCFCLSGRQFSAPMVAAILTIIGFSTNDTIVIFDRIREDLKLGIRGTFMEVMNKALNQTLSRTIITSGTVFLATMSLYLFGGGVINDFAFTFLVGILTGTYSSIYICSALVLWWHKGERPDLGATQLAAETAAPARA